MMPTALRAVLDTNVVIGVHKSRSANSPNREIFTRWQNAEFDLLYSEDIFFEYVEQLTQLGISEATIKKFVTALIAIGYEVEIVYFHHQHYPVDPDDIAFLLCASNGDATHIVSHDRHLLRFNHHYPFTICKPNDFLSALKQTKEQS